MTTTRIALLRACGAERPYSASKPLEIVQATLDPPGHGELQVKIAAAGLCHSDLSVINGDRPRPTPIALGHEAAGVVEVVGPGVTRFSVGDPVVLVFAPSCGGCAPCAEGRPALCEPAAAAAVRNELLSGAQRIRVDGVPVGHHIGVSAFSDRVVVDQGSCVKIDPATPLEQAALLGCAAVTGVGAVINTGGLKLGQTCAVVGLGGVGLAALLGARAAGARRVIAVDPSADKRAKALELGADVAVDATADDAADQVRAASDGGVDLAVEVAGVVPALELAYDVTRRGGVTVTAGLPHPDARMRLPAVTLTATERTLKGSFMGSCAPTRDVPRFAAMMMDGRLPLERLVTHRLRLEDVNDGFERLAAGDAIRQVIVFDAA